MLTGEIECTLTKMSLRTNQKRSVTRHLPSVYKHRTSLHQAFILKGNKVLAVAFNAIGSRSRGCGYSDQTIHAERAVVKKLGNVSKLRGATLVVLRYNNQGDMCGSKPCSECQVFLKKCVEKYGLLKVVHS